MPHRRRKIHGLYFHSSPPRVLPMNNPMSIKAKDEKAGKEAMVIKPSSIRIWIHDKDIGKLTKVLWEGHGMRLRTETSSNPKVKKFLDSIPYVTNLIKDIHTATIDNDLDTLKAKTQPPVPRIVLSSKDANGLTPLHKASGLAHTRIVEYLLSLWPTAAAEVDNTGRTPLHYAASAKNNDRCFNLLVQAGSDETLTDQKHHTANFYKHKPNDLDRSLLSVVPEAPRIPQTQNVAEFDWGILGEENVSASQGNIATNGDADSNGNSSLTNRTSKLPRPTFYSEQNISNILSKEPPIEAGALQKSESIPGLENALEDNIDNTSEPDLNVETPETTILQASDLDSNDNRGVEIITDESEEIVSSPITHSDVYQAPNHAEGQNGNTARHEDEDERYSVDGDIEGDEYDTDEDQNGDHTNVKNKNRLNPENDHISNNNDNNDNDNENEQVNDNEHTHELISDETNEDNISIDNKEDETNQVEDNVSASEDVHNADEVVNDAHDEENANGNNVPNEDENTNKNNDEADNVDDDHEKIDLNNNTDVSNNIDEHNDNDNDIDKNSLDENDPINNNVNEDNDHNNDDDADKAEILIIDQDEANFDKETEMHIIEDETFVKNDDDNTEMHDDDDIKSSHGADIESNDQNDDHTNDERKSSKHSTTDDDDDVVNEHDIESPSPALEIQGVVKGEPSESGQLQSQGGLLSNEDEDARLQAIIDSGDMEQLASLVLCGDGAKLVGMASDSPEIQAFLDNVTAYMNKIRKVHLAAREGSLRDLQSALDRRKFAIAKDHISPNGATPLHVATIFGHSSVVRYLAGRFPETTSAVDNNGRTALHYAATVHDNGHFYNLLVHLGANPKAEDNSGYTPEFYLNHEKAEPIFSHKQLLRDYGVEEQTVDEMLNDQESRNERNNGQQVEIPLFRTEEGRYLASSLGDPLIKGLTEVANKRPDDPITFLANYLFNFANTKKSENFKDIKLIANEENNNDENELNMNKAATDQQQQIGREPDEPAKETIIEKENGFQSTKMIENHQDDYPSSSDGPEAAPTSEDRDEHGQSMLHFACARSHGRNGLIQLIEESGTSITFRDELYRSARDVSLQANQPDNAKEIDRYVLSLAARGDLETFQSFVIEGYDHVLDVTDNDGNNIIEVAESRRNNDLVEFLKGVRDFEESREKFHKAIRQGDLQEVQRFTKRSEGSRFIRAKNYYGRCALHIAVLKENEEIVEYLATNFKHALRIGDNLERTPLHYAMGVTSVESLSRILIRNGAKRVLKDLKGRQPSYYFMNKADILRLQEEEDH